MNQNQSNECIYSQYILCAAFFIGFFKILIVLKRWVWPFFRRNQDLFKNYGGGWALITGGSEGIGLAISIQLAKSGFNICLMSRSQQKLADARAKLFLANSRIEVKTFSVDFQQLQTQEQYQELLKKVADLDVSVLVNNVGIFNQGKFKDIPLSKIKAQMSINLLPTSIMVRLLLQKMLTRKSKSAIINLSSGSILSYIEGYANYSSTKLFNDHFTHCLINQFADENVDFMALRPFYVSTAMVAHTSSFIHVSPQKCAKGALHDLGRQKVSYGHFNHRMLGVTLEYLPKLIVSIFVGFGEWVLERKKKKQK